MRQNLFSSPIQNKAFECGSIKTPTSDSFQNCSAQILSTKFSWLAT
jgi:hypothetical protein